MLEERGHSWYTGNGIIGFKGGYAMVSYKPLWRVLVEREMSKGDLRKAADISPNTMTKLRKNEEVSMSILGRICSTLKVDYGDIVEFVPDNLKNE